MIDSNTGRYHLRSQSANQAGDKIRGQPQQVRPRNYTGFEINELVDYEQDIEIDGIDRIPEYKYQRTEPENQS